MRVLVIEDNPANLELMSYLLRAFGHTAITVSDGEIGIEAACRDRPDVVICDVQLPGIDGLEVARRIKNDAALRTVPLVAVTAYAMVGDRDKVLAAGFDGYLSKPIVPETFVAQVESFVPGYSPGGPVEGPASTAVFAVDDSALDAALVGSFPPSAAMRGE